MPATRVVVVLGGIPHPYGDVTGRWSFSLLKGLAARGFDVRCLAPAGRSDWIAGAETHLRPLDVSVTFVPTGTCNDWLARKMRTARRPFSHGVGPEMERALDAEQRRGYDVLQLEQLWTGYLAEGRPRTLTSVHYLQRIDLKRQWHLSPTFLASKLLLQAAETRLIRRLTDVRTLTPRLETVVRTINPRARVSTVPISIDSSFFEFVPQDRHPDPVFGFVGHMGWNPGYRAAVRLITRILPKVRARVPDARVLLAGWDAERALWSYAGLPGVEIVGDVPNPRRYFERLQVLAYPLPRGSGMMVKVLEALAYGIPVVTTPEGIEGIDAVDGVHALVADDDERFADRVVEALRDSALRLRLRQNGRQLLEERYSPAATAAALETVYERL